MSVAQHGGRLSSRTPDAHILPVRMVCRLYNFCLNTQAGGTHCYCTNDYSTDNLYNATGTSDETYNPRVGYSTFLRHPVVGGVQTHTALPAPAHASLTPYTHTSLLALHFAPAPWLGPRA